MKTRQELEIIKSFVDNTYNSFGNLLLVDTSKVYKKDSNNLGYCSKTTHDDGDSTYQIVCSKLEIPRSDLRILMHEYGHIYLGHMDGIHEELDSRLLGVIKNNRVELIDRINKECGIDFADKLIEKVIDDPYLNHSLHNIAMDMEVNSVILSTPDVEELETDIDSVEAIPLEKLKDSIKNDSALSDKDKEDAIGEVDKVIAKRKIKLIVPERYHINETTPFPSGLTYPEYLILIVTHLDQFVKMLVSIKSGGNGDTSGISSDDVQNALNGMGSGGSGDGDPSQEGNSDGSGSPGMQNLSDLMSQLGLSDPDGKDSKDDKGKDQGKSKGKSKDSGNESGNGGNLDHSTPERKEADKKRELGQIESSGGIGCGKGGGPDAVREVIDRDPINMGLDDVIKNFKSKVLKISTKKDCLYNYNRGINRTVIAPTFRRKLTIETDPTIVFLIDVSGSMDTALVDRILKTISIKMKSINKGLKYNIITWSTRLGEHIKDIDPKKPVPKISVGGGTSMAGGITYFKNNYKDNAILILISDFEDSLEEWNRVEMTMPTYSMFGFNYGYRACTQSFRYFKVKECNERR